VHKVWVSHPARGEFFSKVSPYKARQAGKLKPAQLDEVAEGKKRLRDIAFAKPKRKRQSKPRKPLEDRVWPVWQRFLKSTQWATNEVDEVKRIVHGWTGAKKAA